VVRTVGNAPELEATAETPATAAVADETSGSNDTSAPSPDLAPANTSAPATTLLTSQAPSLESAPAPTVEAPAPAAPLEQVADVVIERLEDGGGEARLVLDPPDLGEVVIRLHTRADHVRVEVIVERPEALLMLRDGSPSLQALLAQRGLDLGDATFLLSQQRGEQHGEAGEQMAEAESGFAGLLGFDEPGDPSTTHNLQRLRSAYNPDGALLYRV
jgi:flagellar hook-length control protein FliK